MRLGASQSRSMQSSPHSKREKEVVRVILSVRVNHFNLSGAGHGQESRDHGL